MRTTPGWRRRCAPGSAPCARVSTSWWRRTVGELHEALDELEGVVEFLAGLEAAFDAEGHQRAAAAVEILLGEPVVRAFRERGVVDPRHAAMVAEEFGDAPAVLDVALDPQRECLDALQQEERAQRREHGA